MPASDFSSSTAAEFEEHTHAPRVLSNKSTRNKVIDSNDALEVLKRDYGLCYIGKDIAVLSSPVFDEDCDGMYDLGVAGVRRTLMVMYPGLKNIKTKRFFHDEAEKIVDLAMRDRDMRSRRYETTLGVWVLADCVLKVSMTDTGKGHIQRLERVDPADHVVQREKWPVRLRPSSLEAYHEAKARMAALILEWADGNPARADRIVELVFAGLLMPTPTEFGGAYLYGQGSCGKSTCLDLAKQLIGSANIFTVSLNSLSDSHVTSGLMGKRLLACDDNTSATLNQHTTALAKSITNGRDINVNPKFKNPDATFEPVHVIIASNHPLMLPKDEDPTPWLRRLHAIRFKRKFLNGGRRTQHTEREQEMSDLATSIASNPDNMCALLHLAVEGLQRLFKNGVTEVPEDDEMYAEWLGDAACVERFIRECGLTGQDLPNHLCYLSGGGYGAGLLVAPLRNLETAASVFEKALCEDVSAYEAREPNAPLPQKNVYDVRRAVLVNYKCEDSIKRNVSIVGFTNTCDVLYARYRIWERQRQGADKPKGELGRKRFFEQLSTLGYHSLPIWTRFALNPLARHSVRIIVPRTVTDMDGVRAWARQLQSEYDAAHRVDRYPMMGEVVGRHGTEAPDVDPTRTFDATREIALAHGGIPDESCIASLDSVRARAYPDPYAKSRLLVPKIDFDSYAGLSDEAKADIDARAADAIARESAWQNAVRDAILSDKRHDFDIIESYGLSWEHYTCSCEKPGIKMYDKKRAKIFDSHTWTAKKLAERLARKEINVMALVFELLHVLGLGPDLPLDESVEAVRRVWPCTDDMCDSGTLELILRALFAYVHVRARDLFRELCPDDYAAVDMEPMVAFKEQAYRLWLNQYRPIYLDPRLNEIVARVIHYDAYAAEQGEPNCPQHLLCDVIGGGHGPKLHLDALKHFYKDDE